MRRPHRPQQLPAQGVEPDEHRNVVRLAAAGDALLSPSVTRQLIAEFVSQPSKPLASLAGRAEEQRRFEAERLARWFDE